MDIDELDLLMTEEFLDSLNDFKVENTMPSIPEWVIGNSEHTTFKAWGVIIKLKNQKEHQIHIYGKVADNKTPKSLYQLTKSEVAKLVDVSPQSLFYSSGFSDDIRDFFKEINEKLYDIYELEQKKQKQRSKKSGVRIKKKGDLVDEVQLLRKTVKELEARTVKETLDLMLQNMPFDLRNKLKM